MDIITIINVWEVGILPDDINLLLAMQTIVYSAQEVARKASENTEDISLAEMLAQEQEYFETIAEGLANKINHLSPSDINQWNTLL